MNSFFQRTFAREEITVSPCSTGDLRLLIREALNALLELAWWLATYKRKIRIAVQNRIIKTSLLYRDLDLETKRQVMDLCGGIRGQ